jgi:hypothetical protein
MTLQDDGVGQIVAGREIDDSAPGRIAGVNGLLDWRRIFRFAISSGAELAHVKDETAVGHPELLRGAGP